MAKDMYVGVDGKARRVKAVYAGVEGKARKVTAGYVGVAGKARCFYSGEDANPGFEYTGEWERSNNSVWDGLTIDGKPAKVYMLTTSGQLTTQRAGRIWGLGGGGSGASGCDTNYSDSTGTGAFHWSGNGGGSGYFDEAELQIGEYNVTIGQGGLGREVVSLWGGTAIDTATRGNDGGSTEVTKAGSRILLALGGSYDGSGGSGGGGVCRENGSNNACDIKGGSGSGKRLTAFGKSIHEAFMNWYCGGGGAECVHVKIRMGHGLSSGWDGYDGASRWMPYSQATKDGWPYDTSVHNTYGSYGVGGPGGYPDGREGGGCGGFFGDGDWTNDRGNPGQDATGYGNGGGGGCGNGGGCGKGGNGSQGVVLIAIQDE